MTRSLTDLDRSWLRSLIDQVGPAAVLRFVGHLVGAEHTNLAKRKAIMEMVLEAARLLQDKEPTP